MVGGAGRGEGVNGMVLKRDVDVGLKNGRCTQVGKGRSNGVRTVGRHCKVVHRGQLARVGPHLDQLNRLHFFPADESMETQLSLVTVGDVRFLGKEVTSDYDSQRQVVFFFLGCLLASSSAAVSFGCSLW